MVLIGCSRDESEENEKNTKESREKRGRICANLCTKLKKNIDEEFLSSQN